MSVWKCYIIPISLFSILYNIPKFMELKVTWISEIVVSLKNSLNVLIFPLTSNEYFKDKHRFQFQVS